MKTLLATFLFLLSLNTYSDVTNNTGKIINITSIGQGLLIIMDTGKPSGCTQTTNWMLIPEENKTMIAVALAMYLQGKTNATVYVDINATGNYCKVVQYDPK
ncbi:hypothetical protein [Teredinibacter sp. KSP-S5-2]|uniref:hypothetical protein n=1 Tax=Teredinibacter sp. KSP-S5-2 TaxID=3034506 RepID=UPI002934B86C|nr:hypothetical protein [Teredinibacter sp. KSP-S5-2]WNO08681.1 hypothetical protein P5V12_17050 [Teredinibacter sp. KSP-S5-2]